jgi:hypothetical protein
MNNLVERKVTMVLELLKLTEQLFKHITVECQFNKCKYLNGRVTLIIQFINFMFLNL